MRKSWMKKSWMKKRWDEEEMGEDGKTGYLSGVFCAPS